MESASRSRFQRYGSAVFSILLATLARTLLSPALGARYPFFTFYIAVLFTAWFGGLGPSLLALGLGALSAAYFFIAPAHSLRMADASDWLAAGLYLFVGLTSSAFSEVLGVARRRAEASAQEALRHQRSLEREIEERQRLEEALQARAAALESQQAELRRVNQAKDDFLSMLAHELRNPLAPIRNAVELLQQIGPPDARLARLREIIERQVEHLTRLVDDLLDVSRITRSKIGLHRERLDLVSLVRTAAEEGRPLLEEAGLTLDLELPPETVWLDGDATRLTQILSNLLHNAAKFTDRGGMVTVRAAVESGGRRAAVTVRDTGIGIDPELLPHVFESFTQADRSLDRSRGGLGLGLSLVKGLVELHGGEVRAESAGQGHGSVFTVQLPILAVEPAAAPAGDLIVSAPVSRGPLRVLVVEDNHDAAETVRDLLELFGCTVEVAYSGPVALQAAGPFRPDVVLCDIGLPGMDGYQVAAALRQDPVIARAFLVAITGYGQEEDQRRARAAGFDLHLTKPVRLVELQQLLELTPEHDRVS